MNCPNCGARVSMKLDSVEREYLVAISRAADDMDAYELSLGLTEYRSHYKVGEQNREDV